MLCLFSPVHCGGGLQAQKGMEHSNQNTCSVGCNGYFYTFTGDFKKDDGAVGAGKPADRQIYAYNLTSGVVFENNGEKTRGGAGCACGELLPTDDVSGPHVTFWAGGFSDAGASAQVEVWRTPEVRVAGLAPASVDALCLRYLCLQLWRVGVAAIVAGCWLLCCRGTVFSAAVTLLAFSAAVAVVVVCAAPHRPAGACQSCLWAMTCGTSLVWAAAPWPSSLAVPTARSCTTP